MSATAQAEATAATGTQAQFAAANGWARSYVTRLKQDGRLVFTPAGLVDFAASMKLIRATTGAIERASPPVQGSELEHTVDLGRVAEAVGKRMEVARRINELIEVDRVKAAQAHALTLFRRHLEGLPMRLAIEAMACNGSEQRMAAVFAEHIEDALRALAKNMAEAMAGVDGDADDYAA